MHRFPLTRRLALPRCLPAALALLVAPAFADKPVQVDVQLDIRHDVGGVSEFDRSVFLSVHGDPYEPEWRSESDKLDYFVNDLNAHFGRETGWISGALRDAREDPDRPGYVDPAYIAELAAERRQDFAGYSDTHRLAKGQEVIVAAQLHPFWPGEKPTKAGWTLSATDTPDEPFRTASGEFMGRYLQAMYGPVTRPKPRYIEVVNEPLYELSTHGDTPPAKVFEYHNTVADLIRQYNDDVLVGGFTMAFPLFERDDFGRWHERFKSFVDIAGDNMDFFSIHLYDFPGISRGKVRLRRGSNIEATFDMIDQYSELKLGHRKPYLISEYGSQMHDWFNQPWEPEIDGNILKAGNAMVMQFMERPDQVLKAALFAMPKAEWGRRSAEWPYSWRMMRRANEGDADLSDDNEGPWVWTEVIKFFELWSEVDGTRVYTTSSNPDIQAQAYADGQRLYLILNNLDDHPHDIQPHLVAPNFPLPTGARVRLMDYPQGEPRLVETELRRVPETYTLPALGTAIFAIDYPRPITPRQSASEAKYFATDYLQPIEKRQPIRFDIPNVELGEHGQATLRLGVGRDHGHSPVPASVRLNGRPLRLPDNLRGDDTQADRQRFFGLLEIPVPYNFLRDNNTVIVTYPDTNGHVSTAALRVVNLSRPIDNPS
ncbi:MAG: agarase [Planctomycetota bacterium]